MPHVLAVFEYPTLNGGERSFLSVLEYLRRADFRVSAAAPDGGPLAEALARHNVPLHAFGFRDSSGRREALEDLRAQFAELIAAIEPDILHANSLSVSRISGPVAAASRLPSVGYVRDILRLRQAEIADLNCHTRLLAVSAATRDFHVDAGLDPRRTFVVHNGVDTTMFSPAARSGWLHRELGLSAAARLIGTIGQIALRKGTDVSLEAVRDLVADYPDTHLVVVGERFSQKQESRDLEERLRQWAAAPPLNGHVHFLGTRKDVDRILPELELLVHAARQEPLGRVLLEAAACGVPIIATDVGGTREIFGAGKPAALLVAADNVQAIASALRRLLDDSSLCLQLGRAARERIEEGFRVEIAAEALIHQYRAVCPSARQ